MYIKPIPKRTDEWSTPSSLFDRLDQEFNFTLDPCSTNENAKCRKHYTMEENGLLKSWNNENVFCNPPYGRSIYSWVEKAYKESQGNCTVVMLLPASTDTKWFHRFCIKAESVRFIEGRLHFGGSKNVAPFPSMVVVFRRKHEKE